MNSILLTLVVATAFISSAVGKYSAQDSSYNVTCMDLANKHVKEEFQAALNYLTMAAWANQFDVNRPGLASFFFNSASEEREHGLKIVSYLRMRGYQNLEIFTTELKPDEKYSQDLTMKKALENALTMEKHVTGSIRNVIDNCNEDYHLADWLTTEFMDEQLKGQRNVAGLLNTLQGLMKKQPRLGEWIFDRKLPSGI